MSTSKLLLEDFLPYRLSVLSNKISRAIADGYEEKFQLTLPEWRVMAILGEEPNISANQVAKKTAMDKVAVSRAVNNLIKKGRVERHFSDQDKRRSVLALSSEGEQIYQDIIPIALSYEAHILDTFSDTEMQQLDTLLRKLSKTQITI